MAVINRIKIRSEPVAGGCPSAIDDIINDLKKIINKKNILVIHTNSENNIENKELGIIEERIYGVSKIYFAKLNLT